MEKLDAKIQEIRDEIKELKHHLELVKKGIDPPSPKQEGDSPRKRIPKDKEKLKKKIATVRERLHKWEIKKIEKVSSLAFLNSFLTMVHRMKTRRFLPRHQR